MCESPRYPELEVLGEGRVLLLCLPPSSPKATKYIYTYTHRHIHMSYIHIHNHDIYTGIHMSHTHIQRDSK